MILPASKSKASERHTVLTLIYFWKMVVIGGASHLNFTSNITGDVALFDGFAFVEFLFAFCKGDF